MPHKKPKNKNTDSRSGQELIGELAALAGDDCSSVQKIEQELYEIVADAGKSASHVTLDDLRQSLLEYLEIVNQEMCEAEDLQAAQDMGALGSKNERLPYDHTSADHGDSPRPNLANQSENVLIRASKNDSLKLC